MDSSRLKVLWDFALSHIEYLHMGGKYYPKETGRDGFYSAALSAMAMIETATHGRLRNVEGSAEYGYECGTVSINDLLKRLLFELVENFGAYATRYGVSGKSQSTEGVSESETYKNVAEREREAEALIFRYLDGITDDNGTPLLYRGCSV